MSIQKSLSRYVVGIFEEEHTLLAAIRSLKADGLRIEEVYSPYPVHGIDEALGYKHSRLPIAAFLFGLLGTIGALVMQIGMMTLDWPMIIGGKDHFPWPTFIPVTFELTVLFAAFGMVGVFFMVSNLKPWGKPTLFDARCTNDKHVLVLALADQTDKDLSEEQVVTKLTHVGASEATCMYHPDTSSVTVTDKPA